MKGDGIIKDKLICVNSLAVQKVGYFCSNCGRRAKLIAPGTYMCKHCAVILNGSDYTSNDGHIIDTFAGLLVQKGWPNVANNTISVEALREAYEINKQECQDSIIPIKKHLATGKIILTHPFLYDIIGNCKCKIRFIPAAKKETLMALIDLMPTTTGVLITTAEALITECNQIFATDRSYLMGERLRRKVETEHINTIMLCGDYIANRGQINFLFGEKHYALADVDTTDLELTNEYL